MADWAGHSRSNYFRVKDVDAFRAEMLKASEGLVVSPEDTEDPNRVCVLETYGEGWPSYGYDEVTGDEYELYLPELIAPHMEPGEVCILMECGSEKLRYVTGHAVAFDSTGEEVHLYLNDIYRMAEEKFGAMKVSIAEY